MGDLFPCQGGERIHLAPTADSSDGWQATIRHIALEGRAHYPADFELKEALRAAPEVAYAGAALSERRCS